jgi:hypothetical protein
MGKTKVSTSCLCIVRKENLNFQSLVSPKEIKSACALIDFSRLCSLRDRTSSLHRAHANAKKPPKDFKNVNKNQMHLILRNFFQSSPNERTSLLGKRFEKFTNRSRRFLPQFIQKRFSKNASS